MLHRCNTTQCTDVNMYNTVHILYIHTTQYTCFHAYIQHGLIYTNKYSHNLPYTDKHNSNHIHLSDLPSTGYKAIHIGRHCHRVCAKINGNNVAILTHNHPFSAVSKKYEGFLCGTQLLVHYMLNLNSGWFLRRTS